MSDPRLVRLRPLSRSESRDIGQAMIESYMRSVREEEQREWMALPWWGRLLIRVVPSRILNPVLDGAWKLRVWCEVLWRAIDGPRRTPKDTR